MTQETSSPSQPASSSPTATHPGCMAIARTKAELKASLANLRSKPSATLALVPTMGALHAGHIHLIEQARRHTDHVAASIFVNPAQFAPTEDLATYPRNEAADLEKLKKAGVSLVWMPTADAMYPAGFSSAVLPPSAASNLESDHRPHFFQGVTTVVAKLFNQVQPDYAVFGEKDYQQLCVVRALVRDLDFNLEIIGAPTVREPDGLALSSRNAYLSAKERTIAPSLYATLKALSREIASGVDIKVAKTKATEKLLAAGFSKVDYVDVRDAKTLEPLTTVEQKASMPDNAGRILAAAWLGNTRLIDNIPL
ncbi:MAG: pantoate--beta-alanine ligase [Pseudomonadota bacterium]